MPALSTALILTATLAAAEVPEPLAFIGIDVVTMVEGQEIARDRTVVIHGGRIAAVGPRADTPVPEEARRIDGRMRFLMPGLADLHVHLEHFEDPAVLDLFLAHGVTTVRNMDGRPRVLDWRRRVAAGELLGPHIVTAGPILDGDPPMRRDNTPVASARAARAAVAAQAAAGYDFVKVYTNLSPKAYRAVVAAAEKHGLPVAGHVPRFVDLGEAMAAGQASIEHLDGYDGWIEADDSPHRGGWHWSKLYLAIPIDDAKLRQAARRTASAGTWNVPTLVEKAQLAPLPELRARLSDPGLKHLPPAVRAFSDPDRWPAGQRRLLEEATAEDFALLARGAEHRARLVKALHEAGAGLLVGTDTPNPFLLPGRSVLREIALLVETGLPAEAALAAATREAARFLGRLADSGTVEVGKRADLLVLAADPLESVANLHRRAGLVLGGRWLSEATLRGRLPTYP